MFHFHMGWSAVLHGRGQALSGGVLYVAAECWEQPCLGLEQFQSGWNRLKILLQADKEAFWS